MNDRQFDRMIEILECIAGSLIIISDTVEALEITKDDVGVAVGETIIPFPSNQE